MIQVTYSDFKGLTIMDYIVKGILTFILLIVFLWATIVSVPASISTSIDGNIMLTIILLLSCGVVIFGWKLSGKIVESDFYDNFQAEIMYTPNNAQLKAIMLPSLIICVCTLVVSYLNQTEEAFLTDTAGMLFIGSLAYGIITLNFWFIGGLIGANSPHYENSTKLRLSSLWAILAPISFAVLFVYANYFLILAQFCIMLGLRIWFFLIARQAK
jgi:hypothetical protein